MAHTVAIDRALYLARTEAELERLDESAEGDAILVGERNDLVALVEDEVLLSLPMAAMHEAGQCPSTGTE